MDILAEFERQVQNLKTKGYPDIQTAHLLTQLDQIPNKDIDIANGYLPFVLVIKNPQLDKINNLVVKLDPLTPNDFSPVDVSIPDSPVYIIVDIYRGKEFLNITPEVAKKEIVKNNRSPLTIDEGIAILTYYPEFLIKNHCFSLLASRHAGDQRVPALWINANKQTNLGWCWDRNPHTWLGSAYCNKRVH